jgi:hypothetical protein
MIPIFREQVKTASIHVKRIGPQYTWFFFKRHPVDIKFPIILKLQLSASFLRVTSDKVSQVS